MGEQYEKKITWTIKNFSSLQSKKIYSDEFIVDGCRWVLHAYPKGYFDDDDDDDDADDSLSVFLEVANYGSMPLGWSRRTKVCFILVNQYLDKLSKRDELEKVFHQEAVDWGCHYMCPLKELHAKDSGFLVNGELKIVAEIHVLEVVGTLDVTEKDSTIMETIHVNGFQLHSSQVKSVSRLFERHPEIASEVRSKNTNIRTGYMSLLLSLIDTMCQPPNELSREDFVEAYAAIGFMADAGFKVDWLVKKLDELSGKKEKNQAGETRLQEMEQELKGLKRKWSDMEVVVEKEKGKVLAAKAPFSFDDVV